MIRHTNSSGSGTVNAMSPWLRRGTLVESRSDAISEAAIPLAYGLGQNAPNPFNRSTLIRFDLPERSKVSIVVYDISGRHIATLADGESEPGSHRVSWSGETRSGGTADVGVYFVRMTANSVTSTHRFSSLKKMVLVR